MSIEKQESTRSARDARLNLRTTARQDSLIRQAANAVDKSVSEFVLESATVSAENVLADRRIFAVSDEAWEAFEAALNCPAVVKPRLRNLLSGDSPVESGQ